MLVNRCRSMSSLSQCTVGLLESTNRLILDACKLMHKTAYKMHEAYTVRIERYITFSLTCRGCCTLWLGTCSTRLSPSSTCLTTTLTMCTGAPPTLAGSQATPTSHMAHWPMERRACWWVQLLSFFCCLWFSCQSPQHPGHMTTSHYFWNVL